MPVSPIRDGFHALTPYLFAEGADRLIDFLAAAFGAETTTLERRPGGEVLHAELRIGDSMLMLGEAGDPFGPMAASIYLYVEDCDAVSHQAIAVGGQSVFEITDLPSGERYGGVRDAWGNLWWIATHVEDLSPEEQEERWKEFGKD